MTLRKMAVKEDLMGSRVKMIAVLYKTFLQTDQIIKVFAGESKKLGRIFFTVIFAMDPSFDTGQKKAQKPKRAQKTKYGPTDVMLPPWTSNWPESND